MEYGALRSLPATEEDDCASLSPVKKYRPAFKSWSSHARLQLSEDLVAEILTRLPAKSVAKFRCVSTTWLSIATDPSFILAHARRSPKTLLVRSFSTIGRQLGPFRSKLFSFSASGLSFGQLSLDQISDVARSSCNGLVLFLRMGKLLPSCEFYVMNPLTGLFIDIPNPNESNKKSSMLELYYHRWTGEYRILNIRNCKDLMSSHSRYLDAEVLSLAGDCPSPSWSQIKAKVPFVSFFFNQSGVLVNDRLYWTCQKFSEVCTILVFDILKETFNFMEPPSYGQKASPPFADKSCSEFGLVDIEGNLCFWVVYKDKSCMENITIHVWTAMDGDEKLKNTYSMCFNDERLWAFYYPHNTQFRIVCCLCVRESELLFLFDVQHNLMEDNSLTEQPLDYLFHWDLKSGKYWTEPLPAGLRVMMSSGIIYKETLITTPFRHTTALTHALL